MLNSVPTSPSIPRVPVTFEIIISDQHFSVGFFGLFGPLFRYFCLRSEFGLGKRSNVGIFEMDLFECDYECWMYYYHKWVWKSVSDLQRLYLYLYLYFCWDLELEPQWEWRGQAPEHPIGELCRVGVSEDCVSGLLLKVVSEGCT